MSSTFRRLRQFSRVLNHLHTGNICLRPRRGADLDALPSISSGNGHMNVRGRSIYRGFRAHRFSTVAEPSQGPIVEDDLLSFFKSTFDHLEGPHHCWLNKLEAGKDVRGKNDVFLVLAGAFPLDSMVSGCNADDMLEKVKLLQQRYPKLHVVGFQSSLRTFIKAIHVLSRMTVEDYITFPILLSSKTFTEVESAPCFILFKGFRSPAVSYEGNLDIGVLDRAVKELMLCGGIEEETNPLKGTWVKQTEAIKRPVACSSMQNLLLHFPGGISSDERSNRLFLSDTNHHRIIIFDDSGKILDCIGSSPGFEDGDFEAAKLRRPAASFYHETEDCLYFVDSENHAVRRADMERRFVETIHPSSNANKNNNSLWRWIVDKFWTERNIDDRLEKLDSESFMFPWHLIKSSEEDIFVLNQNFETLWIMDLASGAIKDIVKGFPKILEICGQLILAKSSLVQQIPGDCLKQEVDINGNFAAIPHASLVSSIATFRDHVVICDKAGQRVLKINKESRISSSFNFSNFGILGLPYWVASPLERVYSVDDYALPSVHDDHRENFSLKPGMVDIQLNVDLPEDIELVEPLQEGCVWRQARGAATEVSGAKSKEASIEKLGIAQKWYDEIDHLVLPQDVRQTEGRNHSEVSVPEGGVCIHCTIQTSPGTSEVVISAALYLKLKRNPNSTGDSNEKLATRIADILNPKGAGKIGKSACFHLLMKSNSNLEELVFMKPVNVRLNFDTCNHPKAENTKDFVLTDSYLKVNVSLQ